MESKKTIIKKIRLKSLKFAVLIGIINILFDFIGYVFKIEDTITIKKVLFEFVANIIICYSIVLFLLKAKNNTI